MISAEEVRKIGCSMNPLSLSLDVIEHDIIMRQKLGYHYVLYPSWRKADSKVVDCLKSLGFEVEMIDKSNSNQEMLCITW